MSDFTEYMHEVFEPFGPITTRRMFGGHGVYHHGLMLALVFKDQLYLKTDAHNVGEFLRLNLPAFTFEQKGKPVQLSYRQAPDAMLDDREQARLWAQSAWDAALRAQALKVKKPAGKIRKFI